MTTHTMPPPLLNAEHRFQLVEGVLGGRDGMLDGSGILENLMVIASRMYFITEEVYLIKFFLEEL